MGKEGREVEEVKRRGPGKKQVLYPEPCLFALTLYLDGYIHLVMKYLSTLASSIGLTANCCQGNLQCIPPAPVCPAFPHTPACPPTWIENLLLKGLTTSPTTGQFTLTDPFLLNGIDRGTANFEPLSAHAPTPVARAPRLPFLTLLSFHSSSLHSKLPLTHSPFHHNHNHKQLQHATTRTAHQGTQHNCRFTRCQKDLPGPTIQLPTRFTALVLFSKPSLPLLGCQLSRPPQEPA